MSNWTQESIQEAVNAASERAGTDEAFRELCKNDIHSAIKEVSGKEVPADFKINVVDNTGYHISVTLPALQKADGELGDSELESVAGGSKDSGIEYMDDISKYTSGPCMIVNPRVNVQL